MTTYTLLWNGSKGGPGTAGMHTPSSTAAFKEPSKGSEKNHNLITMRTALAAVAIIVLALGWTAEAVHVEVKCTCPALWASVSLLNRSRLQNPPVAFGG